MQASRTIRQIVREFVEHYGPVQNHQVRDGLCRKPESINRALADLASQGRIKRITRGKYTVQGQRQNPVFPWHSK